MQVLMVRVRVKVRVLSSRVRVQVLVHCFRVRVLEICTQVLVLVLVLELWYRALSLPNSHFFSIFSFNLAFQLRLLVYFRFSYITDFACSP